jgi:hypothetical protein
VEIGQAVDKGIPVVAEITRKAERARKCPEQILRLYQFLGGQLEDEPASRPQDGQLIGQQPVVLRSEDDPRRYPLSEHEQGYCHGKDPTK